MAATDHRVMRIPLPVPLIREMDAVIIQGIGGYATRAEFIVDAIQERILELSVEETEDAGPPPRQEEEPGAQPYESTVRKTIPVTSRKDRPTTVLSPPVAGYVVPAAGDLSRPESRALFGLHNRDYPSLWALTKLAALAAEGPIPVEDYVTDVLREAWRFGELLLATEKDTGAKCTALFPTNSDKRKPAETGFRSFALGDYRVDGDVYSTNGPLYEWRVAGLTMGESHEPRVGLTGAGWDLLRGIAGISVEEPHPYNAARVFFEHLANFAPEDWRGFTEIISAIGSGGASRQDVLAHVAQAWPSWTNNEVSTNAAGYIARAREWGLIEPKQTKSKYHLTPLGHEHSTGGKQ
ncbi:ribbon-helix-helix domain-containing protein [Gordonia insulae]|uniref:Uncharacterized protein n=1 Tax=Gordonia insulae TaxID=2420509 RepID=A0A3G8JRT4_9ACTN|nr:ribbon-helix-helix domain-containing protein [Gordonia insulae]AZG47182.1 hypothetical protein D7316_03790 [Gordonia insulae]